MAEVQTPILRPTKNKRVLDLIDEEEEVTFTFTGKARNMPKRRRIDFASVELEATLPYEPPTKKTKWQWRDKLPALFKFVDDGSLFSKVNMYNATTRLVDGVVYHEKRDIFTENIFNRSKSRAEDKGMKINVKKTAMIVISAAISFVPQCYIQTRDNELIRSGQSNVKILGFTFEERPTVSAHVLELVKKARRRYWVLRHLQSYGFSQAELVQVYKSLIRSVLEYCGVVFHSMLTEELSDLLERVQYQALKCIYGYTGDSYRALRELSGLATLKERRLASIDRFVDKCLNGRFAEWFPLRNITRNTRMTRPYEERYARCDRLKNSPLYFIRKRLNDRVQCGEVQYKSNSE
jgi:hypothetical protein